MAQKHLAGRRRPTGSREARAVVAVQAGPYLQLEPDLTTGLDAGQTQLPTVDAQEHSVGLHRQHVYLLWGRAERRGLGGSDEEAAMARSLVLLSP